MLNPYFKNYLITLQEDLNYRADFFIRFFTGFLELYARVAIWYTIVVVSGSVFTKDVASDTIKYMILASIISMVFGALPEDEITRRVTSGEIGRDLIYPVLLPAVLFFRGLGNATVVVITRALPALIFLSFIYKPNWDFSFAKIAGLLVSIFFSFYLYFLVNLMIDMISFWFLENFVLSTIRYALFNVLSGSMVPLWFYPKWFLKIVDFLPFKTMVYTPLAFYFDKIPADQLFIQILISLFWMTFITVLVFVMWRVGVRKVEVQGG